ncbi:DUF2087 domain-containing protein [Paenibacillus mendelii]|uniref:DUF2087 domain-containing protein n=1 Tax=Paenibacillus mendelii TaxID=206163 RepID=A0ABV6J8H3_9BACL|nr:DUF2087 domain-containing protein [Paenibacillus mendelii]MCQ6559522.1 DUF2087 domain-containing protein [Paenibacillus mendelii]
MNLSERFDEASLLELKQGFLYDADAESYICLLCGERFEEGVVYPADSRFLEARKYAAYHVSSVHGSMLDYYLSLDKKATGLTDLQKQLIAAFASGMSDAATVQLTGGGSASTIRNHRFALKEKAKQAKLFLAIMEMMDSKVPGGAKFVPIHHTAPQVDERYALTQDEYAALLSKYLPHGLEGPLTGLPRKQKHKVALLRHIAAGFEKGIRYEEREINEILMRFSDEEYVTLRRHLIDYGFLGREDDGRAYWLNI